MIWGKRHMQVAVPIGGFPDYEITNDGRVWSKPRRGTGCSIHGRWLRAGNDRCGYPRVTLCTDGKHTNKNVHRLVLETFVGPCPPGMEACHNNGIKTDNRAENLRWDMRKGNARDAVKHGTCSLLSPNLVRPTGEQHGNTTLTETEVRWIEYLRRAGIPRKDLAEVYHTSKSTISNIALHQTWRHLWARN